MNVDIHHDIANCTTLWGIRRASPAAIAFWIYTNKWSLAIHHRDNIIVCWLMIFKIWFLSLSFKHSMKTFCTISKSKDVTLLRKSFCRSNNIILWWQCRRVAQFIININCRLRPLLSHRLWFHCFVRLLKIMQSS